MAGGNAVMADVGALSVIQDPNPVTRNGAELREFWGIRRRAASESRDCNLAGGAERDRTADLVIANDALSQLSYSPSPVARGTFG